MTRRCSHCSNNGHNSRTCPNRVLKIFGVRITEGSIRKSASTGNLTHYTGSGSSSNNLLNGVSGSGDSPGDTNAAAAAGYVSEGFVAGSSSTRRKKKGVSWTEEEHRMFLLGLQKLGKGDWRGISRTYLNSRTPTQIASHAQKYFLRQSNVSRRKRRSSLLDIVLPDDDDDDDFVQAQPEPQTIPTLEEVGESMESENSNTVDFPVDPAPLNPETSQCLYPVMVSLIPVAVPYWPGEGSSVSTTESHEVLKPTAVHSKNPIDVDGMSKLSLGSPKLVGGSSGRSAFHASNPGPRTYDLDLNRSPIHAV